MNHHGWDAENAKVLTVDDLYFELGEPKPFKLEYSWVDANVLPICKENK